MLDVDIGHLISFNEELAHKLSNEPADIIPIVGAPTLAKILSLPNH